jgi:hypothetical protein
MHSEASGNNIWHPGDREIAVVAIGGAIYRLFTAEALRLQEAYSNHCLSNGDEQCLRGPQVARSLFKINVTTWELSNVQGHPKVL